MVSERIYFSLFFAATAVLVVLETTAGLPTNSTSPNNNHNNNNKTSTRTRPLPAAATATTGAGRQKAPKPANFVLTPDKLDESSLRGGGGGGGGGGGQLACGISIYSGGRRHSEGESSEHGGGDGDHGDHGGGDGSGDGGGEGGGEHGHGEEHGGQDEGHAGEGAGGEHGELGEQSAPAELRERSRKPAEVVGGQEARPGEHPWLAKVLFKGGGHCGGAILSPHWVLTAAHCLYSCKESQAYTTNQITVVVGAHEKERPDHGRLHTAERLIVHEGYCTEHWGNSPDDIGLIRLSEPIQFGLRKEGFGSVNAICLPPAGAAYPPGEQFQVAGWGRTQFPAESYAAALQQVQVPHVESGQCQQLLHKLLFLQPPLKPIKMNFDPAHEICAGGVENESSCKGDSGGPLTRDMADGAKELVGVVSRGQLCAHQDSPNVYARVESYMGWIGDKARD